MDNLMLLTETSGNPSSEVAETVSYAVQSSSSGGLRLIGFVLIIMMIILALLTATLIAMEIRQDSSRKMITAIAKRLERIEKKLVESAEENIRNSESDTRKVSSRRSSSPHSSAATYSLEDRTDSPPSANYYSENPKAKKPSSNKDPSSEGKTNLHSKDTVGLTENHSSNAFLNVPSVPEKPYPIAGLRVNASSHYNQNNPVRFDEVPTQDAIFILYSDLTVSPNSRQFNFFNNASYYTNHDFTMIFDFMDKEGYLIEMRHPIKCLKLSSAATVINSQNGYLLVEKGILIAEER